MKKKLQELLDAVREYIINHHYEDTPILTVYANVDSTDPHNRRDKPKWAIELGNEAKRLKELEDENKRLKQLVAEKELDIQMLKFISEGNW